MFSTLSPHFLLFFFYMYHRKRVKHIYHTTWRQFETAHNEQHVGRSDRWCPVARQTFSALSINSHYFPRGIQNIHSSIDLFQRYFFTWMMYCLYTCSHGLNIAEILKYTCCMCGSLIQRVIMSPWFGCNHGSQAYSLFLNGYLLNLLLWNFKYKCFEAWYKDFSCNQD